MSGIEFWSKAFRKLCRLVVCVAICSGVRQWLGDDADGWIVFGLCVLVFLVEDMAGDEDLL